VLLQISETAFTEEAGPDEGTRAVRLRFTLPAGGYATVVVAAVAQELC
jgi:tRNA(Glu) U13 pseudouridine synthase TruD